MLSYAGFCVLEPSSTVTYSRRLAQVEFLMWKLGRKNDCGSSWVSYLEP